MKKKKKQCGRKKFGENRSEGERKTFKGRTA